MKWAMAILLIMGITSCKPEYHGDGVLNFSHGLLWTPIYEIKMPEIDISKPHVVKYDLVGIPPSKAFYSITLEVPSSGEITSSNRESWGKCSFTLKKNGMVVRTRCTEFSRMINCISGTDQYLNGFYMEWFDLMVPDPKDHWELIFECAGFESSKPVDGYIVLHSGGE